MSSMQIGLVLLALFAVSFCDVHNIKVFRHLNNGEAFDKKEALIFSLEDDWTDSPKLTIRFDLQPPTNFTTILSSTLYFANNEKRITEVVFGDGLITSESYKKPWNFENGSNHSTFNANVSPSKADVELDVSWLPRNVTRVSASVEALSDEEEHVTFNYYGIKNFQISLPDTYVVENYQPIDLTMVTL